MVRPKKPRFVESEPSVTYFKPRAVPLSQLEEVDLSIEELEAIRLKDLECEGQVDAAKRMGVSQPTLHRLLVSARRKVAEALVHGKAIKIHGGSNSIRKEE